MVFAYQFAAEFGDGTQLDQGDDISVLFPGKSRFTDLLHFCKEKELVAFYLLGRGRVFKLDMRDGTFNFEGGENVSWVEGALETLPAGATPALVYYRNNRVVFDKPNAQPVVTQFCMGWEAGGVRKVLGISPLERTS